MATSPLSSSSAAGTNTSATLSTDVYNRVQKTMSAQNGVATKLNTALKADQTKLSGLGQLKSALSAFQTLASSLRGGGLSTSATASDKSVLSVSANGSAKAGSYALNVRQLAQGQFLTSEAFASSDSKLGSGAGGSTIATVKVDFGTAGEQGFRLNGTSASKTITIDSSNNTLDGIAAAFKAAGVDVKVLKGDDGKFSLAMTGASGAANSMRISVSGDAALKSLLSFDPDGKQQLKQGVAASNAMLTLGDQEISSASNTLDKAIPGLTLKLSGTGKTELKVTQDASQISSNLKSFVSAYNELNKKLQALQKGELKGDTALNQASGQLNMLLKTSGGISQSALAASGISQDSSGNLVLDDKKLAAALKDDASAVSKLFTNDGRGLADLMGAKAASLTGESSALNKETALVSKEITSITAKRATLSKALTAQATALAALYTAQAQTGAGSAVNGSTGSSGTLFDMLG
jgi:flagellar hook-associated protein 2